MKVTWHGHATFLVETRDGTRVAIDPFFGHGKSRRTWRDLHPALVLVTHGHGDHTGDVLHLKDVPLIANYEIATFLEARGVADATGMNAGGSTRVGSGLKVTMVPAAHSSGLAAFPNPDGSMPYGGSPCGYLLDDGQTRLYVAGDTGLFGDLKWVVRDVLRPDVAVLPIGDLYTMGPEHAAIAAEWTGAKVAVPCHYGSFPGLVEDAGEFTTRLAGKVDVRAPAVDGSVDLVGGKVRE